MNIATLTIEMAANVARLRQDMDKAASVVQGATAKMQAAAELAGKALGLLGLTLSVGAFTGFVRNAINAADALDEMSGRIGVSAKELSGLQLAYMQAGMGNDAMAASIAKLSQEMSQGNLGLRALGINARDASGNLRAPTAVLMELADKFSGLEDGAGKTALAIEIFGKSGAEMVPLLNSGSAGIAELTAMAARLGLVIEDETAAQAGQFNDTLELLGLGLQGVGARIAAQVLPTLNSLTGSFLESMSQGEGLRRTADFLAASMKILYTVGVGIVEVFSSIGKTVGAAAAQVVAILRGDFAAARAIGQEWQRDMAAGWAASGKAISQAWSEEGNAAVEHAAKVSRVSGDLLAMQKAREEAAKKGAKAAEDNARQFASMLESVTKATAMYQAEQAAGDKLTEGQKKAVEVLEQVRSGKVKLTEAQAILLGQALEAMLAAERENEQQQQFVETANAARAARLKIAESAEQAAASLADQNKSLELEIQMIGRSATEQLRIEQARNRVTIGTKRATLAELELQAALSGTMTREQIALAAEIEQLERRNELLDQRHVRQQEADAWTSFWQSVDSTAHGAFVNVFEDGAGTFKRLRDTAKATLLDMLYQLTFKRWIINISANVTGAGGVGGSILEALTGGDSGLMGWANMASSLWSAFTGGSAAAMGGMFTQFGTLFGNAAATQFGMGMSGMYMAPGMVGPGVSSAAGAAGAGAASLAGWGAGVAGGIYGGRMISGGYSAIGGSGNTAVNGGTLIGAILGGPLGALLGGLAGGVVNRLFGRKLKDSGIEGQFGGESGFEGRTFQYFKGGLFRSNKTVYGDLEEETRKGLADMFNAMREGARGMAEVLGLGTTAIDDFTASFKISLQGLSAEEAEKRIREEFDKVAEALAATALGTTELSRAGESALDTLTRLSSSLVGVNGVFENLGYALYESSLAGAAMASELVDLFGGMEGFNSATSSFFQNFYSPQEQREAMRRQLEAEFARMDLKLPDIDAADARDQFRALAEAQDRTTEAGRRNWAMLMQLSDEFAAVTAAGADAAATVRTMADAAKENFGITAETIKGLLDEVLENATSAQEARSMGAAGFEDMVLTSIFDSLASNLAGAVMAQVVAPMIAGATTSSSLLTAGGAAGGAATAGGGALGGAAAAESMASGGSAAASAMVSGGVAVGQIVGSALDGMRAQMAAVGSMFKDPAFLDMIRDAGSMFGDIAGDLFDLQGTIAGVGAGFASAGGAAASAAGSVKSSWEGVADSLIAEVKRIRGEIAGETASQGFAHAQALYAIAVAQASAGDQQAAQSLPGLSRSMLEAAQGVMATAAEYRFFAATTAATLADIATSRGGSVQRDKEREEAERKRILDQDDQARWLAAWQAAGQPAYFEWDGTTLRTHWELPAYANGGTHAGGWALVGERGPELAYMPPSRIYTADQTRSLLAGGAGQGGLAEVIAMLERRLSAMAGELSEMKGHLLRMRESLEDFDREGMPVVNRQGTKLETATT